MYLHTDFPSVSVGDVVRRKERVVEMVTEQKSHSEKLSYKQQCIEIISSTKS